MAIAKGIVRSEGELQVLWSGQSCTTLSQGWSNLGKIRSKDTECIFQRL